jgi:hypothetical protein
MRVRKGILIAALVAIPVLAAAIAEAQPTGPKVALVIGNAAYRAVGRPLIEPIKDARAVAEELRRDGFDVLVGEDLTKQRMRATLENFRAKIKPGAAALLFFSGYGIQTSKQSYLVPVDAEIWTEGDIRRDGISVERILAEMEAAGAHIKVVIIDAARRNRFRAGPAGLASLNTPAGTLATYSTAPGRTLSETGDGGSLFVTELLKAMRVTASSAEEVFNQTRINVARASRNAQVPSVFSSLTEQFYFVGPPPPSSTMITSAPSASSRPSMGTPLAGPAPPPPPATLAPTPPASRPGTAASRPPQPTAVAPRPGARVRVGGALPPSGGAAKAAPKTSAEPTLPEFPWPPPASSASFVLSNDLFSRRQRVGEVVGDIIAALERTGYVERSFFRTQQNGVVLVTRLERINEEGFPVPEPERWSTGARPLTSAADLVRALRGLFFVDPGHFRVIVFVMQGAFFLQSSQVVSGEDARGWLRTGANVLPSDIAERPYAGMHCTALIYEFASDGVAVRVVESRLTGKQHLERAGVFNHLGKAN